MTACRVGFRRSLTQGFTEQGKVLLHESASEEYSSRRKHKLDSHVLGLVHEASVDATRARTALNVFRTGPTSTAIENAFAKPALMDVDALFEEDA